jgi:hypothetical protein
LAQFKKPSRSQSKKIRAIKAKNYSPAYEKRLIRGILKGKSTQEARGHKPGEARQRREFQREQNEGLSNAEDASIRNWYVKRFNPHERKSYPTEEDVIEFARESGIEAFRAYQHTWNAARSTYVREQKSGTYASRGEQYLEYLTEQARVRPQGDREWLYYH